MLPVAGNPDVTGFPNEPDMQVALGSRKRGFAQRNADHRTLRDRLGDEAEELRKRGMKIREEAVRKRGPDDQGDRETARRAPPEVEVLDNGRTPLNLDRESEEKKSVQRTFR